jgi:hypothetical protein
MKGPLFSSRSPRAHYSLRFRYLSRTTIARAGAFPPVSCGHDVGFGSTCPHHYGGRPVTGSTNRAQRIERRRVRESRGFGRHLTWVPEGFPEAAVDSWPRKAGWPTSTDVLRFVEDTRGRPDARLAVLTGLRRWSEPASSQLLITVAAIIVSIVAVILTVSDVGFLLRIGMVGAGLTYIAVAVFAMYLALAMDQRRKMAHSWLRALEDQIALDATRIVAMKQPDGTPGTRSWWDAILA